MKDKRTLKRAVELDKLFQTLRSKKEQLKKIKGVYEQYKQELINTQKNYMKLNKLL